MSGHKRTRVAINPEIYHQMHEKEMQQKFSAHKNNEKTKTNNFHKSTTNNLPVTLRRSRWLDSIISLTDPFQQVYGTEGSLTDVREAGNPGCEPGAQNITESEIIESPGLNKMTQQVSASHQPACPAFSPVKRQYPDNAQPIIRHGLERGTYSSRYNSIGDRSTSTTALINRSKKTDRVSSPSSSVSDVSEWSGLSEDTIRSEPLIDCDFNLLYSTLKDLLVMAEDYLYCQAWDPQGNTLEAIIQTDEWTSGKLSNLISSLHVLRNQLDTSSEIDNFAFNQINAFLENACHELDEIVFQARMNVIQSQLRINIADQMANELTMQGYQVQTGGYLSGNLLNAYAVSMVHPDGSQVDINIEPPVGVSDLQQVQVHTNRIPHTEQVALDPWSGFTDGYQLTRSESEILSYEPLMHQNI